MQRDEQLMTADDDFLMNEIAGDLSITLRTNDPIQQRKLIKEALEDFLELVRRKL